MLPRLLSRKTRLLWIASAVLLGSIASTAAETCLTSTDMDDATSAALKSTGQRYFDMAAKGDAESLRQSAIPGVASDFSGIAAVIKAKQSALSGTTATQRSAFVLVAEGTAPVARAEFLCGVFGKNGQTSGSAVFVLNDLPPAKYAVVILDDTSAKPPHTVAFVLQQMGSDWKLGGLYIQPLQSAGHDKDWFAAQARDYKSKGQTHNAWLYFLAARGLASALPFMQTAMTDKLYDESQAMMPADFPSDGKSANLAAGTATYKLTDLFPEAVGSDLDLIVKYSVADISNTTQTYQNNLAVSKALIAKYPELKDAFVGIVARAVDPSGRDYGTLLAMKDLK